MWCSCKSFLFAAATLFFVSLNVSAFEVKESLISRSEWPQYENGPTLLSLPALQKTLARFNESPGQSITIRHPGGDSGRQWGEKVYQWFVAFGVPLEYLVMEAGSGGADQILVVFIDREKS